VALTTTALRVCRRFFQDFKAFVTNFTLKPARLCSLVRCCRRTASRHSKTTPPALQRARPGTGRNPASYGGAREAAAEQSAQVGHRPSAAPVRPCPSRRSCLATLASRKEPAPCGAGSAQRFLGPEPVLSSPQAPGGVMPGRFRTPARIAQEAASPAKKPPSGPLTIPMGNVGRRGRAGEDRSFPHPE
jgi:hypothetical protein